MTMTVEQLVKGLLEVPQGLPIRVQLHGGDVVELISVGVEYVHHAELRIKAGPTEEEEEVESDDGITDETDDYSDYYDDDSIPPNAGSSS